jgi:hypothetical protein
MVDGKKLEAAASVPEVIASPVRSSPRLAQSKDEHILDRAEERAAKKNLEHVGGMPSTNSLFFLSFF